MKYRVLIEQDEDGMFVVQVPSLPGCISQGSTRKDALNNIREAISVYLVITDAKEQFECLTENPFIPEKCFGKM